MEACGSSRRAGQRARSETLDTHSMRTSGTHLVDAGCVRLIDGQPHEGEEAGGAVARCQQLQRTRVPLESRGHGSALLVLPPAHWRRGKHQRQQTGDNGQNEERVGRAGGQHRADDVNGGLHRCFRGACQVCVGIHLTAWWRGCRHREVECIAGGSFISAGSAYAAPPLPNRASHHSRPGSATHCQ